MPDTILSASRVVVFVSALVYWAGVYIQARRIRRRIGRSPNVKPRGTKERILWALWFLVVVMWLSLPFLAATPEGALPGFRIIDRLYGLAGFCMGSVLMAAGYAGTLWCYAAMGNVWRMGINRTEKTPLVKHGPFRFVRHPIYLFQLLMLAAVVLLLPTPVSFMVLIIHVCCILTKAADEEGYLRTVHGTEYADYVSRSGRFFPRLRGRSKP